MTSAVSVAFRGHQIGLRRPTLVHLVSCIANFPKGSNLHSLTSHDHRPGQLLQYADCFQRCWLRSLSTSVPTPKSEHSSSSPSLSNKTTSTNTNNSQGTSEKSSICLYEKDPKDNYAPRAVLALAYFSSTYWTWYAVDYIPVVNNSGIPDLYISQWVGVAGCTLAYAVNIAACLYVTQMVSKIVLQKDSPKPVHVYRFSLPFMLPSTKPLEYGFGEATLDSNSDYCMKLFDSIEKKGTHLIKGHIALNAKDKKWPYGMYVKTTDDIKDKDLFLEVLLFATVSKGGSRQKTKDLASSNTNKLHRSINVNKNTTKQKIKIKGRRRK